MPSSAFNYSNGFKRTALASAFAVPNTCVYTLKPVDTAGFLYHTIFIDITSATDTGCKVVISPFFPFANNKQCSYSTLADDDTLNGQGVLSWTVETNKAHAIAFGVGSDKLSGLIFPAINVAVKNFSGQAVTVAFAELWSGR